LRGCTLAHAPFHPGYGPTVRAVLSVHRNLCSIAPFPLFPLPEIRFMITVAHIQPLVALIAGILILLVPRLLNYIVAIYLIVVGITGLGLIH
jgi:hypothetical protein